jgi:hypothetical protein
VDTTPVTGSASVQFPYLAGGAHRGRNVFVVGWSCASEDCPGSRTISIDVANGNCASDLWCGENEDNPLRGRAFSATVTVPNGQEVEAVEFDGAGKCRIIPTGADCGV